MALLKSADLVSFSKALGNSRLGAFVFNSVDQGCIPAHRLKFGQQPTANDTITIGANVYQFLSAAGSVTDDAYIAVLIAGSAALTAANLVAAINATDANNAHATLFKTDDTTPALANGTVNVVADIVETDVIRVRPSDRPGGTALADSPSVTVGEAVTHAEVIWQYGNVNLNTLGGRAPGRKFAIGQVTVTAAMVTLGKVVIEVPFTVGGCTAHVKSSAGVERASVDTVTFATTLITIDLDGGASPDIQATDVVTYIAFE